MIKRSVGEHIKDLKQRFSGRNPSLGEILESEVNPNLNLPIYKGDKPLKIAFEDSVNRMTGRSGWDISATPDGNFIISGKSNGIQHKVNADYDRSKTLQENMDRVHDRLVNNLIKEGQINSKYKGLRNAVEITEFEDKLAEFQKTHPILGDSLEYKKKLIEEITKKRRTLSPSLFF